MKFALVMGTRPEVIKLAPVYHALKKKKHEVLVISTGQHRELLDPLFKFFNIRPNLDLKVMSPNQTLTYLSARVLEEFDRLSLSPDYLIVQGDTTSAFIASYWAFCKKIAVAHVEAGLRTHNLLAPFPEEANRQLIGRLAALHFVPTQDAEQNLLNEGIPKEKIKKVGNTAIDALLFASHRLDQKAVKFTSPIVRKIKKWALGKKVVLATVHRREIFGREFEQVCSGMLAAVEKNREVRIIYPVHPNPNIRVPAQRILGDHPQIFLCDPLLYVDFVALMKNADVILTDSGGVQEEAPSLLKPILVVRKETERPEGVRAGYARLIGTNPKHIFQAVNQALETGCTGKGPNPYGDGKTAARIVKCFEQAR